MFRAPWDSVSNEKWMQLTAELLAGLQPSAVCIPIPSMQYNKPQRKYLVNNKKVHLRVHTHCYCASLPPFSSSIRNHALLSIHLSISNASTTNIWPELAELRSIKINRPTHWRPTGIGIWKDTDIYWGAAQRAQRGGECGSSKGKPLE